MFQGKRTRFLFKRTRPFLLSKITKGEVGLTSPEDAWDLILTKLEPKELCHTRQTCSNFRRKSDQLFLTAKIGFAKTHRRNLFNFALEVGDLKLLKEVLPTTKAQSLILALKAICKGGTLEIVKFLLKEKPGTIHIFEGEKRDWLLQAGKIEIALYVGTHEFSFSHFSDISNALQIFDKIGSLHYLSTYYKTKEKQRQALEEFSKIVTPERYQSWKASDTLQEYLHNITEIPSVHTFKYHEYFLGRSFTPQVVVKAITSDYPDVVLRIMITGYRTSQLNEYLQEFRLTEDHRQKYNIASLYQLEGKSSLKVAKFISPYYLDQYSNPFDDPTEEHRGLLLYFLSL